jgi:hypothetical protein
MGAGDRSFVPVGPDDPDAALTEDLGEGGRSDPESRRGGDPGFPERRYGQSGVDEHFGHGHRPAGGVF